MYITIEVKTSPNKYGRDDETVTASCEIGDLNDVQTDNWLHSSLSTILLTLKERVKAQKPQPEEEAKHLEAFPPVPKKRAVDTF